MKYKRLFTIGVLLLAGCAQTSIQPLSRNTFKVATQAAPACGQEGARKVAYRAAAIQVIKNGGDRFIIVGDQTGSRMVGGSFTQYGGYQTYNSHLQDMVVKMLSPNDPEYSNGLSARETLGADWQEIVSKKPSNTCTD